MSVSRSSSAPLTVAFTKTFPVTSGSDASRDLKAMVEPDSRDAPEISFTVFAEDPNGSTRRIGYTRPISLHDILDNGNDILQHLVDVVPATSHSGKSIGGLYVDVKAKKVLDRILGY